MKKNGVAYGLFDGQMYPFATCSWMNLRSSSCSATVRAYIFPGIVVGALGFNSIAWSQMRGPRNLWAADSEKTCVCCRYSSSMFWKALQSSSEILSGGKDM